MNNCFFCYKPTTNGKYHESCSNRFFGTSKMPELDLDREKFDRLTQLVVTKRMAITGVQPKLSLNLEKEKDKNRLTIVGLWGEYILKPQSEDFPFMPEVEDLTMHLAKIFRIKTAKHALIPTTSGELTYITKRFDRKNSKKIHVEDFCQLSELMTEQKYKSSYERAGKIIQKYASNTGFDTIQFFQVVLFSFLTGNNDMHLKNFSLIHSNKGILFSPAYDLLNINLIFPEDTEDLALTLNGKKRKIKLKDFDSLAGALKIPTKVKENIYDLFFSKTVMSDVEHLINSSFLNNEYKQKYFEIFQNKINQLN